MSNFNSILIYGRQYIGYKIRVIGGSSSSHIGLEGEIIDETLNSFRIRSGDSIKVLPKRNLVFCLNFKDSNYYLEGNSLVNHPFNRFKRLRSKLH